MRLAWILAAAGLWCGVGNRAGAEESAAPDTSAAVGALVEFEPLCRLDGDGLWGMSLCGPVVLVDWSTRFAVTNAPDPGGAFTPYRGMFVGRLPGEVPVANTAVEWGGGRWTMVMLPLLEDRFARLQLLAHDASIASSPI